MSVQKDDYLGTKLPKGCPVEHAQIVEGDDNSSGKIVDVHKIPEKEEGWDGVKNHDAQHLAQRIVTLEKKLGELGWEQEESIFVHRAKSGTVPDYDQNITKAPKNVLVGHGEQDIESVIEDVAFTAAGNDHAQTLVLLDRAIQVIANRVLGSNATVNPIGGNDIDNFDGSYKNKIEVTRDMVTGSTLVDNIPDPDNYVTEDEKYEEVTTSTAITHPVNYKTTDSNQEAIAKLDWAVRVLEDTVTNTFARNAIERTNLDSRVTKNEQILVEHDDKIFGIRDAETGELLTDENGNPVDRGGNIIPYPDRLTLTDVLEFFPVTFSNSIEQGIVVGDASTNAFESVHCEDTLTLLPGKRYVKANCRILHPALRRGGWRYALRLIASYGGNDVVIADEKIVQFKGGDRGHGYYFSLNYAVEGILDLTAETGNVDVDLTIECYLNDPDDGGTLDRHILVGASFFTLVQSNGSAVATGATPSTGESIDEEITDVEVTFWESLGVQAGGLVFDSNLSLDFRAPTSNTIDAGDVSTKPVLHQLAYGNSIYVGMGYLEREANNAIDGGVGPVLWTSSDGTSWTETLLGSLTGKSDATSQNTAKILELIYDNSLFVAVGTNGVIKTSATGLDGAWTDSHFAGIGNAYYDVIWAPFTGNNKFITAGTYFNTSADGLTWGTASDLATAVGTLTGTAHIEHLAFGNDIVVGMGRDDDGAIAVKTTDGSTWTEFAVPATTNTPGTPFKCRGIVYDGAKFVAIDLLGRCVMTSTDGETWVEDNQLFSIAGTNSKQVGSLSYGGGIFTAPSIDSADDLVYVSSDGQSWAQVSAPENGNYSYVDYMNSMFGLIRTYPSTTGTYMIASATAASGVSDQYFFNGYYEKGANTLVVYADGTKLIRGVDFVEDASVSDGDPTNSITLIGTYAGFSGTIEGVNQEAVATSSISGSGAGSPLVADISKFNLSALGTQFSGDDQILGQSSRGFYDIDFSTLNNPVSFVYAITTTTITNTGKGQPKVSIEHAVVKYLWYENSFREFEFDPVTGELKITSTPVQTLEARSGYGAADFEIINRRSYPEIGITGKYPVGRLLEGSTYRLATSSGKLSSGKITNTISGPGSYVELGAPSSTTIIESL